MAVSGMGGIALPAVACGWLPCPCATTPPRAPPPASHHRHHLHPAGYGGGMSSAKAALESDTKVGVGVEGVVGGRVGLWGR